MMMMTMMVAEVEVVVAEVVMVYSGAFSYCGVGMIMVKNIWLDSFPIYSMYYTSVYKLHKEMNTYRLNILIHYVLLYGFLSHILATHKITH